MKEALKYPLLIVRGLNTHGDNHLRIGPFSIGKMLKYIEKKLQHMGVITLLVNDLKCDTLSTQAQTCIDLIEHRDIKKFHILGHSMGGLTARALSHRKEVTQKISSIVTVATPHQGSHLAHTSTNFQEKHPFFFSLALKINGSIKDTKQILKQITPRSMTYFNRSFPTMKHIPSGSVICQLPPNKQSLIFKPFHPTLSQKAFPHDGMLESASQKWGQLIGEYKLDHLSQLGYHGYFSAATRSCQEKTFQQMMEDIFHFMKSTEAHL